MAFVDWNGNGDKNDSFDNFFEYNLITNSARNNRGNSGCGCLTLLIVICVIQLVIAFL